MTAPNYAQRATYTPCGFLEQRDGIANEAASRLLAADPTLNDSRGPFGIAKYREDVGVHILYLAESVAAQDPGLFRNYVRWAEETMHSHGAGSDGLRQSLDVIVAVLRESEYGHAADLAIEYLDDAIERLGRWRGAAVSPLVDAAATAPLMLDALLTCRRSAAIELLDDAVERGMPVADIYLKIFQPVLREVGRLWQLNKITVAQEHYCSAAIQLMMGRLASQIFATKRIGRTIVLACVGKELHEIGLRMVADILEMSGWHTHFLGANVPTADLVEMLRSTRADLLCLSMTLTAHLSHAHETILAIRNEPDLAHVKIVVGGYPFNLQPDLWQTIGADGHATDASTATEKCANLVER